MEALYDFVRKTVHEGICRTVTEMVICSMNKKIVTYRDLIVWQKAMDVAKMIYQRTGRFPSSETYLWDHESDEAGKCLNPFEYRRGSSTKHNGRVSEFSWHCQRVTR